MFFCALKAVLDVLLNDSSVWWIQKLNTERNKLLLEWVTWYVAPGVPGQNG